MISRDVAIIIFSRGREARLARLLDDLTANYVPPLRAAGLSCCICIYAQGYSQAYRELIGSRFKEAVSDGDVLFETSDTRHSRIGEVAHAAIRIVQEKVRYRLAMLADDDSVYYAHEVVDGNLQRAAAAFLSGGHRAFSIKLGDDDTLRYEPFVRPPAPIMPFKEKMLWVSREVLDAVLAVPRFPELSVGEDAVIAGVAWLGGPDACLAVHGFGSFFHLSFERPAEFAGDELRGGYAELTGATLATDAVPGSKYDEALRRGVTPHHVLPEIFVAEDHEHYEFNGIHAHLLDDTHSLSSLPRG